MKEPSKVAYGNELESYLVKRIPGAKRVHRSGAGKWDKADVETPTHLIEAKRTSKKSYAVTLKLWEKTKEAAIRRDKEPAIVVCLEDNAATLVVVSLDAFLELQAKAARLSEEG